MSPTPAERAALRVAEAAAQTPDSAYGLPSAIVFALGSAGLLMDPETAAELVKLRSQKATCEALEAILDAQGAEIDRLRASASAAHDDLVAALGREPGMEWSDLIDITTTAMRTAEGLEATGTKALRDRVAELESLVDASGAAAEQRHQLLDPSEPPLGCFMTGDICAIAIADAMAPHPEPCRFPSGPACTCVPLAVTA